MSQIERMADAIYEDAVDLAKKLRELSEQMRKQDFTVTDGTETKDWTDVVKMRKSVSDIRDFFGCVC